MTKKKIIIDCDPGQDDALMLFLAFAAPEQLDVLGVVAVAGNVSLEKTARNARIICEIAGRDDVPVFAGYDRPMVRPLEIADHVHGREGMNGVDVYEPAIKLQDQHGVDFMIETLRAAQDDEITLVPTGPLTNIAHMITRAPDVLPKIKEIVLMGGALREGGNVTPSAEYNIYVDPHAAHIVFECGRPIVAMGLDVTHQVISSPDVLEKMQALPSKAAIAAAALLQNYEFFDADKYGEKGAPVHDPCTVAYLLKPELFEVKACNVRIETQSKLTMGHTAVDFWDELKLPKNVRWAHKVDRDGFFDLMVEHLARYDHNEVLH